MWTFWANFEEFSKQVSQRFQTGGYGIREFKIGFLGNGVLSGKHQGRRDLDWNMGRVEEREVRCCENWSPFYVCALCLSDKIYWEFSALGFELHNRQLTTLVLNSWHESKVGFKEIHVFFFFEQAIQKCEL
jgi:hypothetical protein